MLRHTPFPHKISARRSVLYGLAFTVAGLFVLISYLETRNGGFWLDLDTTVFRFFNSRLQPDSLFTTVTAATNMRIFDVIGFLAVALLYLFYYLKHPPQDRRKMFAIGLTMLLAAVMIKQCGRLFSIHRPSPTLVLENVTRLSQVTDLPAKDHSGNSFPGDHGMMLMLFSAFMWRYFGLRALTAAAFVTVVFSLPRIMSGAHWFSDVYAGSLAVICIFLSWFLVTPASDFAARQIERLLPATWFSNPKSLFNKNRSGTRRRQ